MGNPLYINFNQMPYIGLWYRCIVFYAAQDQSGSSGRWQCTPMDPTVQVLPGYLIYTRMAIIVSIILALVSLILNILAHPFLAPKFKLDETKSKKLTYIMAWLEIIGGTLSIIACIWFTSSAFTNSLGWMTGSNAPVEFVQSYVSAWKPAWCLVCGLCGTVGELCAGLYTMYVWMNMEPFPEYGGDQSDADTYDEFGNSELAKITHRTRQKLLKQKREETARQPYNDVGFNPTQKADTNGWI